MKSKKGFTLAEVLITLGIIGIVATMVNSVIGNFMPNRDKVLFKKAYGSLAQITDSLINNSAYYGGADTYPDSGYGPGDLRYLGTYSSMSQKFCSLAEPFVDTTSSNCSSKTFTGSDGVVWTFSDNGSTITCTFDVNGSKSGGTYSATISSDGSITPSSSASSLLDNPYDNK